eukprot:TRINITY_DN10201_c0_g1_i1.p1 TRINITY_DN10201_c0_g1~~TRINITY_DN10201_c0_g1_i1.p1  ORF type:complete len:489 (-),score=201.72 TRINITY_DN10201_c0_g1_i1:72-1538(-)
MSRRPSRLETPEDGWTADPPQDAATVRPMTAKQEAALHKAVFELNADPDTIEALLGDEHNDERAQPAAAPQDGEALGEAHEQLGQLRAQLEALTRVLQEKGLLGEEGSTPVAVLPSPASGAPIAGAVLPSPGGAAAAAAAAAASKAEAEKASRAMAEGLRSEMGAMSETMEKMVNEKVAELSAALEAQQAAHAERAQRMDEEQIETEAALALRLQELDARTAAHSESTAALHSTAAQLTAGLEEVREGGSKAVHELQEQLTAQIEAIPSQEAPLQRLTAELGVFRKTMKERRKEDRAWTQAQCDGASNKASEAQAEVAEQLRIKLEAQLEEQTMALDSMQCQLRHLSGELGKKADQAGTQYRLGNTDKKIEEVERSVVAAQAQLSGLAADVKDELASKADKGSVQQVQRELVAMEVAMQEQAAEAAAEAAQHSDAIAERLGELHSCAQHHDEWLLKACWGVAHLAGSTAVPSPPVSYTHLTLPTKRIV